MFEWKKLFDDAVLQRGLNIKPDAIKSITIEDSGLLAKVQGSELYFVKIDKDFRFIVCSCPCQKIYQGFYCKHMVAVISECEKSDDVQIKAFFSR